MKQPKGTIRLRKRYKDILKIPNKKIINIVKKQEQLSKIFGETGGFFEPAGLSRLIIYFTIIQA